MPKLGLVARNCQWAEKNQPPSFLSLHRGLISRKLLWHADNHHHLLISADPISIRDRGTKAGSKVGNPKIEQRAKRKHNDETDRSFLPAFAHFAFSSF